MCCRFLHGDFFLEKWVISTIQCLTIETSLWKNTRIPIKQSPGKPLPVNFLQSRLKRDKLRNASDNRRKWTGQGKTEENYKLQNKWLPQPRPFGVSRLVAKYRKKYRSKIISPFRVIFSRHLIFFLARYFFWLYLSKKRRS